jgi:hypothetical protein
MDPERVQAPALAETAPVLVPVPVDGARHGMRRARRSGPTPWPRRPRVFRVKVPTRDPCRLATRAPPRDRRCPRGRVLPSPPRVATRRECGDQRFRASQADAAVHPVPAQFNPRCLQPVPRCWCHRRTPRESRRVHQSTFVDARSAGVATTRAKTGRPTIVCSVATGARTARTDKWHHAGVRIGLSGEAGAALPFRRLYSTYPSARSSSSRSVGNAIAGARSTALPRSLYEHTPPPRRGVFPSALHGLPLNHQQDTPVELPLLQAMHLEWDDFTPERGGSGRRHHRPADAGVGDAEAAPGTSTPGLHPRPPTCRVTDAAPPP